MRAARRERCGHTHLQARLAAALHAVGARGQADVLFAELARRYGEPHRHYHTLEHVDACLTWLDWMAGTAERPAEVELSLWFHDAVYHPGRPDNEQASADLARHVLAGMGVHLATSDRIAESVAATAQHRPLSADGALVVDIDLSVLGAEPSAYDEFERRVRQEYARVPMAAYRCGRTRVLEEFLARPRIYHTAAMYELLEASARFNLQRAITRLHRPEAEHAKQD
jgi:predicted metal-dependent HD superfamily phosphohydrolase